MTLSAAVLAGDAAAYRLPLGFAASGVVMVGVLRRRQISAAVAGWMFAVASVFYDVAADVLDLLRVEVPEEDAMDVDDVWPEGDLGLLADVGLPAEEMQVILDEVDLHPDEQLEMIAQRRGFRSQPSALLEKQPG